VSVLRVALVAGVVNPHIPMCVLRHACVLCMCVYTVVCVWVCPPTHGFVRQCIMHADSASCTTA
jgi:hypothetical protein